MKTFDVYFNDLSDSNNMSFNTSYNSCLVWIDNNRRDVSTYFGDYVGGTVSIVCNETGEEVYNELITN